MTQDRYIIGFASEAEAYKLSPKEAWKEMRSKQRWHRRYGETRARPGDNGIITTRTTPYGFAFIFDGGVGLPGLEPGTRKL